MQAALIAADVAPNAGEGAARGGTQDAPEALDCDGGDAERAFGLFSKMISDFRQTVGEINLQVKTLSFCVYSTKNVS